MIFETERSRRRLELYCDIVARMKPGDYLQVDPRDLMDISTYEHNCAHFTAADRILGNIVGSAYKHSFEVNKFTGAIVFRRHEDTGERRYVSPDRREA